MKRPDQIKIAPTYEVGNRVPPGQFVSRTFPVLTYGNVPTVDLQTWTLRVFGLVDQETELTWKQFSKLSWTTINADFHCVTQWTSLDNAWEGVPFADLLSLAQPLDHASFIMIHCYGGYTANLPLDLAVKEGLLAHKHNGNELTREHGWPLRLVIPSRYGWKSAKWVNGIEVIAKDTPGFWESRGYNNNGDPWKEERFWPELTN